MLYLLNAVLDLHISKVKVSSIYNIDEKVIKAIPIPIIVFDQDYKVFIINKGFKNVFAAYKQNFRRGQHLDTILEKEQNLLNTIKNHVTNFRLEKQTFRQEVKDTIFEITITKILDQRKPKFCVTLVNVTSEEENEIIKRRFVSNVTHELRTPLAAISSISENIAFADGFTPDEYKESAEIIYNEIQRLSKMVSEILELSKFDQDAMYVTYDTFNIEVLFSDVKRLFKSRAEKKGIELKIQSLDLDIEAEYDKLKQVLINLVENAFLYTKTKVYVTVERKNNKVRITVEDDGIGLTFEQKQLIFTRFYRTDESRTRNSGGTGLGLSIINEIVKKHKGEIYVQSELGVGSEFIVEIPISRR